MTVLLLDSLDEYRDSWGRVPAYLAELLRATTHFRRVIITCRTQFFPKVVHPEANPDLVVLSGFQCPVEYLSPFDRRQVDAFLHKVYPNSLGRRIAKRLRFTGEDNAELKKARELVEPMKSLRCRPMLLGHIGDLMKAPPAKRWDEFNVYRALVEQWWLREEEKNEINRGELHAACGALALELSRKGLRELPERDFQALCTQHQELKPVPKTELAGRSLLNTNSKGDYRFSHYSIQEYLAVAAALEQRGEARASLADITITDQMLRFAQAWVDGVPLSPGSWGDGPAAMSLAELADHAEALRRGLLLRVKPNGAMGADANGTLAPLPDPAGLVPRLEPLGRKAVDPVDLSGAELEKADLRGAYLGGAVLQRARLAGAQLAHANLTDAKLSDADLSETDLRGADFAGADLTGARFGGATHDADTTFPADFDMYRLSVSGYELVWIPGGTFKMGSREAEPGRSSDEGPQHAVELEGFWLGKCPVTNEEYARFLKANPKASKPGYWDNSAYSAPRQPVVAVSWDDAVQYCEWAGLVLPTEAQWEYACRAGTTGHYSSGDSDENLGRVGWFSANSDKRLHAVGEKEANAFGLCDMHGNVWEWCQDWYGSYSESVRKGDGLRAIKSASVRVQHGGSFSTVAVHCRSTNRIHYDPGSRNLGFRPAKAPHRLNAGVEQAVPIPALCT